MPYPRAEARILHEYGPPHVREREPEKARERLSAVSDTFGRLEARKAERTRRSSDISLHLATHQTEVN